jgi:hypothetical protein
MKTLLPFFLLLTLTASSQITTPIIKAGFGVDGELRANFYNGALQNGNDDWFLNNTGMGRNVIDTTGAAAIVAGYLSDVSPWKKRMSSFYRPMSVPQFSIVNNRLWLDALFVRDYHGTDTTVFVGGSNKNGDSPNSWVGGIQGVPDKNDILDMFMHVRRAGPNRTDSLWMFGGLSLDNTTGQRYFDFEMYQTDIYYDRPSGKWFGFGPDAGHTSWQFDAAGNVTRPGDIIFSAEYQSSTLTKIEARIWVDRALLSITPAGFSWSGQFDGASTSAQFGYASILPKTAGAFYTGLGSGNNTWTGPFQLVLVDNSLATNYTRDQFMEFSVNLTKLGLDPVTTFGSDICGTPFNRIVVKTRSSASFTSELKDFVAPTDLFLAPRAQAIADVPLYCGSVGVSNLSVINPSSSSVYTWSTTDGHFYNTTTGPNVTVDSPGTYIVKQQLAAGCNPYAYDTLTILYDASCIPMANRITGLRGTIKYKTAHLNWTTKANKETIYFEVERSINGRDFEKVGRVMAGSPNGEADYSFDDNLATIGSASVYYRLRAVMHVGQANYSGIIMLGMKQDQKDINLFPNPVNDVLQLSVPSSIRQEAKVSVFDISGSLLKTEHFTLNNGVNILQMDAASWKAGTYMVNIKMGDAIVWKKFVVNSTLFNK